MLYLPEDVVGHAKGCDNVHASNTVITLVHFWACYLLPPEMYLLCRVIQFCQHQMPNPGLAGLVKPTGVLPRNLS